MNVAIVGYGKMGKTIARLLLEQHHQVVAIIDQKNYDDIYTLREKDVEVAIEFSSPQATLQNSLTILDQQIPVVCGTTAWLDGLPQVEEKCKEKNEGFIYSPNFSIGVNIFFMTNKKLAQIMNHFPSYNVTIDEIHHTEKLDSPSGTAIETANQIIDNLQRKSSWKLDKTMASSEVLINAHREADVKGEHIVTYKNDIDEIKLSHLAFKRDGFAQGAIMAAEWIIGKKGVYTMEDMLGEVLTI